MSVTIKSRQYDALKGAWLEVGQFTLTPAATAVISANTEIELAIDNTITCNTGDQIFVNPQNIKTGLVPKGARVQSNNTVKVIIANVTGSNITDSTAETFDYQLYHYTNF